MKPIRFGLLGASNIAKNAFIPALKKTDKAVVTAVASRDSSRAEAFAKQHNIPSAYGSYDALLMSQDVDAVYISLPNHLHARWGMKCLEAGKHVIIEKPITTSTKELERLYALAEKRGLIVMEAFMFLFNDRLNKVLAMIKAGMIGSVRRVHADFSIPLFDRNNIRYINAPGAGALSDLGTYTNALAERVMGSWPEQVDCRLVKVSPHHHADIHYSGQLEFSDGRTALFSGGMESCLTCEAIIIGEKGTIILHNFLQSDSTAKILLTREHKEKAIPVKIKNHYVQEIENMVDAINKKKDLFVTKQMTINHRKVLDLCFKSARKGNPLKVKRSFYL